MYLNCHTFHSLRYGTISIEDLVQQAVENNIKTLALTDINTITGIYDFTKLCHQNNIKPVVGVEIRSENELYYITLAKNARGIAEVNKMLTAHNCDGEILPKTNPDFKAVFVIYPLENVPETLLDHEFIGVKAEQLNLIFNSMWKRLVHKMVILQPVTFKTKQEFNLHKILRAIDLNTLISKLDKEDYCKETEILKPENEVLSAFKNYPQIIKKTENLL
jgi:DNA polymerase III alpha subunit